MLPPTMKLIGPPSTELLQFLTEYVTRPWDLDLIDLFTLESCHVMPFWWSMPVPTLRCIWLTVPELWRLQFSIVRQLKVPSFTFYRTSYFNFHLSNPQMALPWRERRIITYWAWGCVQKCDLWAWLRKEKRKKLSCVRLAICPDHPRRCSPLKFCMRGRVREIVTHFKFHENRSRNLGAVRGGVENRPLPLTRPMAYTTACTITAGTLVPAVLMVTSHSYGNGQTLTTHRIRTP